MTKTRSLYHSLTLVFIFDCTINPDGVIILEYPFIYVHTYFSYLLLKFLMSFISWNVVSIFILKSASGNLVIGVPVDLFILSDFFPAGFCLYHIVSLFVCLFLIVCCLLHGKIICVNNLKLG